MTITLELTALEKEMVIFSLCRQITTFHEEITELEKDVHSNRELILKKWERIDDCERIIKKINKEWSKAE
jgi:ribosomal protein S15P/S13E